MKSNTRKYVEFGALCLLAAVILWWFGRKLDWLEVRHAVSRANPYLLALGVLAISLAYVFRAARWGALLAPLCHASLRNLWVATTVGFGAVFLFGRAGEVVRPVVLPMRDPKVRPSASFVTIMIERIYDSIAVVLLFAINLLWFRPPATASVEFGRVRLAGIILLLIALAGVFGLTQFRKKSRGAIGWVRKTLEGKRFVPARVSHAILGILEQLAMALRVLVDARELAVTVGWSAMVWITIAIANMLVFRAFGLPFGITQTVFVLGWSLVGSLVPTPGGAAGAFHAATAAGLILLGVPRDTAAAIAIVLHVVDFGPALIFGLYYVIRGDINLSRLRARTSSEEVEHAVEDEPIISDELLLENNLETAAVPE
ncbi:MAG TPA: lysylphosphatidylglycerol synthase transmembrane domain-containing protein [Pyrinomonadaceae bacterium]|nr:lysylphosphatidylglycerol synthase transmembrane domain-containing protein [Pyrinomonadaceae bacterium]